MQLSDIVPWGRSLSEYRRMFCLSDTDLAGRILGCGDGPASFNAQATALGHHITSCDPMYAFPADTIRQRIHETSQIVSTQARLHADNYCWSEFRDVDHLVAHRLTTMDRFLTDYDEGKRTSRYLPAALPKLPLADNSFTLALVSHLLFLYSEHLCLDFHIQSILELLRVANEVRVFPLLSLDSRPSPHLPPLLDVLQAHGCQAQIVATPYEFQRAPDHYGNRMLRVRRSEPDPSALPFTAHH